MKKLLCGALAIFGMVLMVVGPSYLNPDLYGQETNKVETANI